MPTTIYDSSLVTQRHRDKTISGSFINRIQNPNNPTTSYAPRLGIYDQSIINTVKNGQMTTYRKNDGGCTRINIGCPCTTSSNSVIHNSITIPELGLGGLINPLQLPGSVTDIIVIYGSVIVKWNAPTVGVEEGNPFIYELTTNPVTELIEIVNGVTEYIYDTSTDTPILNPGTAYTFNIIAKNSLGAGEATSTTDLFYAPFQAPLIFNITPYYNGITISFAFNSNLSIYNTYELIIDSNTYIGFILDNEVIFNNLAIDTVYPAGYIVLKNPGENRISNRINIDSFKTLEKNNIKSVTIIDNSSESFGSDTTYYIKIRFEMSIFPGTFNNAELNRNEDELLVSFPITTEDFSFTTFDDYNANTDIILNISTATNLPIYNNIDPNIDIEGCTLKVVLNYYNDINSLDIVSSEFIIKKINDNSFEIIPLS